MNVGILAHVDAGKTTITEQMLHICGITKEVGRVDNGNATTDAMALEKARGITIRQTTVTMKYKDKVINLLDTPGHVDFIAEVERSLSVLDVAILAISAREGVQTQTKVIFNALRKMSIPTMIMVNKVDRMGVDLSEVIDEIRNELNASIYRVNDVGGFGTREVFMQEVNLDAYQSNIECVVMLDEEIFELAICDERAFFDDQVSVLQDAVMKHFLEGSLYPVFFGAALMGLGVAEMLDFIAKLPEPVNEVGLSAVVFKIDRDSSGYRRCFTRIFGGALVLRENYPLEGEDEPFKVLKMDALHGIKPYRRDVAMAGEVVILYTDRLHVGSVIGESPKGRRRLNIASPTLKAKVSCDDLAMRRSVCDALAQLTDEDPFLAFDINTESDAIELKIFGMVQKEIIEQLLHERFGIVTKIMEPEIIYKAKPSATGEACRYMYKEGNHLHATVGLIVEPLPLGEGVVYKTEVSYGDLKKPFQNAVKEGCLRGLRKGVDGLEVTDALVRFVYSEFNSVDSTPSDYRKLSEEVVGLALVVSGTAELEPIYRFELWLPSVYVGRAIADVLKMRGTFEDPVMQGELSILRGRVPQATSQYYEVDLADYTGGKGIISFQPDGYELKQALS